MPDSDLLAAQLRSDARVLRQDADLLATHRTGVAVRYRVVADMLDAAASRIEALEAALTPGATVVGCHTASESGHDRPPGAQR